MLLQPYIGVDASRHKGSSAMSRQLYSVLRGAVRLPNASSSARHHARLTIFVISIVVVAFNCRWVFRDFEMYLSPIELRLISGFPPVRERFTPALSLAWRAIRCL